MGITHVNRRGETYNLQRGTNARGKEHFWFGGKITGTPVEQLPEGFEIHEKPESAQVFLRKITPSPILAKELEQVRAAVGRQVGEGLSLVEIEGKGGREIVVYLADADPDERLKELYAKFPMLAAAEAGTRDFMWRMRSFGKMMRFTLVEGEARHFSVARWCFRGSIDNWYFLEGGAPLAKQLAKYVPHLGRESFYELGGGLHIAPSAR